MLKLNVGENVGTLPLHTYKKDSACFLALPVRGNTCAYYVLYGSLLYLTRLAYPNSLPLYDAVFLYRHSN